MRQVTGSNLTTENKKASIQVTLDGPSFSTEGVVVDESAEQVTFVIDTPRVTLAPREEVSLDTAESLLRLAGHPCRSNECSVCSELQNDIVAIMAIDRTALEIIIDKWGSRASFSSPLLDMRHAEERCITVSTSRKVCYIHHFDNGLQRAEAFEIGNEEDILCLITEWQEVAGKETPIYISGEHSRSRILSKYIKNIVCE